MKTNLLVSILAVLIFCGLASASGLVAHWTFDEGTGTIAHDSAGSNDGTLVNGPVWTTGQINDALNFDGINDYIAIPNAPDLNPTNAITLAAWYKPISYSGAGNDPIITKGYTSHIPPHYQYHLGVAGDLYPNSGRAGFSFNLSVNGTSWSVSTGGGYWTPGQWYFIVGAYDGNSIKLYVNSNLITSKSVSGTINSYPTNVLIAKYNNLSKYLPGIVDDVRIYNCALDANAIAQLYQDGLVELESIKIVGPNSVPEESDTQYHIVGHYDNGSNAPITSDVNFAVMPDEFAVIDANCLLSTDRLYRPRESCTIYADYKGFTDSKQVNIYPLCDGNECTPRQLIHRNTRDVIEIKRGIMEELDYAMRIERVSNQMLISLVRDNRIKGWERSTLTRANIKLLAALADELWAKREIGNSIESLRQALEILQLEKPGNNK